jgi:biopolymer transport protein ExbD
MLLPEIQEALTVVIKTGGVSPGQPDKLLIKRKTEPAPQQLADATVAWDKAVQELSGTLKRFKKESGGDNIKIEADADLRQEYVIEVYDVAKLAGFSKIHFVPPPLLRQVEK